MKKILFLLSLILCLGARAEETFPDVKLVNVPEKLKDMYYCVRLCSEELSRNRVVNQAKEMFEKGPENYYTPSSTITWAYYYSEDNFDFGLHGSSSVPFRYGYNSMIPVSSNYSLLPIHNEPQPNWKECLYFSGDEEKLTMSIFITDTKTIELGHRYFIYYVENAEREGNSFIVDLNEAELIKDNYTGTDDVNAYNNLVLKDDEPVPDILLDYRNDSKYKAYNASYVRNVTSNWNSLILPFNVNQIPDGVTIYAIKDVDANESKLILEEVHEISSYTPYLFYSATTGYDVTFNAYNNGYYLYFRNNYYWEYDNYTAIGNSYFDGALEWTIIGSKKEDKWLDDYYLKDGKFYQGYGYFIVPPYRCYFHLDNGSVEAKTLRMCFGDDATGINTVSGDAVKVEAIYDADGKIFDAPQKGLNIIKYSNGTKGKLWVK